MTTIPTAETHPKVHLWCVANGYSDSAAAKLFGVSRQIVRLWRLPFADPRRARPRDDDLIERVMTCTHGEITAGDWFPPRLRGAPPDPRGGDPVVLKHARAG